MRIADMNWMQVRDHAAKDDRAVLPIGSTEQHAHLSLSVDTILSERVAAEAAEPLRIPVFPVIAYGLTPNFVEYPGTVTLRMATMCALVTDVLDGIVRSGFRRILIVNGHGGNIPVHGAVLEWLGRNHGCRVQVAQLVERAEDLGQGDGDRSGRLARVVAREFSLDAAARRHAAGRAEADDGPRALRAARSGREEGAAGRRQLRRALSAQRRGDARDVARRRGGNARPDAGRLGVSAEGDAMLGFVIQRLLQAFVVMMVISFLVFLGVYAIGNPIDVLISPDADQRIREMVIRQYGLDLPLWQQYLGFLKRLVVGRFRPLVRLQHAGAGPDPLAPAGDA